MKLSKNDWATIAELLELKIMELELGKNPDSYDVRKWSQLQRLVGYASGRSGESVWKWEDALDESD